MLPAEVVSSWCGSWTFELLVFVLAKKEYPVCVDEQLDMVVAGHNMGGRH